MRRYTEKRPRYEIDFDKVDSLDDVIRILKVVLPREIIAKGMFEEIPDLLAKKTAYYYKGALVSVEEDE